MRGGGGGGRGGRAGGLLKPISTIPSGLVYSFASGFV